MSTGDEQSLLRAIGDDPQADQPRLVYGDLLAERGDPLGELIAVQCALARLAPDASERRKLTLRQNQLLKKVAAAWGPGWKASRGELHYSERTDDFYRDEETVICRFSRGFVDEVDAQYNALVSRADWLDEHAPLLERVRVRVVRGEVPTPRLLALLRRFLPLRGLSLRPTDADDPVALVREIAADPTNAALHELSLERYGWSVDEDNREELEPIARSEVLGGLRVLDLYTYGLHAEEVELLAAAPFRLQTLLLNKSELGPDGAAVLARSAAFAGLEVLGLYHNGLEAQGVAALTASPHLRDLVSLDLRSNRIGRAGAEALGASGLHRLRTLILTGNTLDAGAVAGLCGPGLSALQQLNLQDTRLRDEAVAALVAATDFCRQLRKLNLRSNRLGDEGARRLADCPALSGLVELNLNNNKGIGPEGIAALRASKHLATTTIYLGSKQLARGEKVASKRGRI